MSGTIACRWPLVALAILCSRGPLVAAEPEAAELLATFRREFVEVTPGQANFPAAFSMGNREGQPSEQPEHRVTLSKPFAVARYEVAQNLWQAVMGANRSRWKGPRNSVEMLSHDDAVTFCRKVTDQMRAAGLIKPTQIVRLPTEAEWEYAARAGSTTRYSFGDDAAPLDDYAWSHQNAAGNDPPVGAKKPNAWNLYDIHGYLWEWCADPWHDNYDGAPADGTAWTAGGDPTRRVLRGGSWKDPAEKLTTAYRRPAPADLQDDAVGLRPVLSEK